MEGGHYSATTGGKIIKEPKEAVTMKIKTEFTCGRKRLWFGEKMQKQAFSGLEVFYFLNQVVVMYVHFKRVF